MSGQSHSVGSGDFEKTIGSASKCDVVVSLPEIAPRHAALKRVGDRLFIKSMGDKAEVTINGQKIRARSWVELGPADQTLLATQPLTLDRKVFLARPRLSMESTELRFTGDGGISLCENLFIAARPGTLTAIMGPSGCGKSVLLNLLNAYNRPKEGRVLLRQQSPGGAVCDLHRDHEGVRNVLGYVPQAEVMVPELTVQQSLDYRLRLRFPDMARDTRVRIIRRTCQSLGFDGDRLDRYLTTQIGTPETRDAKVLSGGERRRANIAHELVLQPLVLILDEPTSGLSSVDADQIVELLYRLARDSHIAIITTIHQPSRDAFARFDDLLVVSYVGKLVYYGPANRASEYFKAFTGNDPGQRNPAEYVLDELKNEQLRKQLTDHYARVSARPTYTRKPLTGPDADMLSAAAGNSPHSGSHRRARMKLFSVPFSTPLTLLREWITLSRRNLRVLLQDKMNLILSFGQVPLIALLVLMAFKGSSHDYTASDHFARRVYHFGILKAPYEADRRAVPAERLGREADELAKNDTANIGELTGRQRASILFTLVVASVWFGVMGGCKEIVLEHHIVQREVRSCMRLGPYVLSKAIVLTVIVGLQTSLLAVLIAPRLLNTDAHATLQLWGCMWLTSAVSALIGLLVSALSNTYRVALAAVPLLMIPQLLFGGILRPEAQSVRQTRWPQALGALTIQRWGFEATLRVDRYADQGILVQVMDEAHDGRYSDLNIVSFRNAGLVGSFFDEARSRRHQLRPHYVLGLATLSAMFGAWIVLRRRHRLA